MATNADLAKALSTPFRHLQTPTIDPNVFRALEESGRQRARAVDSQIEVADIARQNLASEFFERLAAQIKQFDESLDDKHEVGVRLVSFGQSITFHVDDLGYHNPSLIIFYGTMDDGQPVSLVQHTSQISFLLTSLKRQDPSKPKRPFGFTSQRVRDFADEAEKRGLDWDDIAHQWVAPDGSRFSPDGTSVEAVAP